MRARVTPEGVLYITPETSTEAFAMMVWEKLEGRSMFIDVGEFAPKALPAVDVTTRPYKEPKAAPKKEESVKTPDPAPEKPKQEAAPVAAVADLPEKDPPAPSLVQSKTKSVAAAASDHRAAVIAELEELGVAVEPRTRITTLEKRLKEAKAQAAAVVSSEPAVEEEPVTAAPEEPVTAAPEEPAGVGEGDYRRRCVRFDAVYGREALGKLFAQCGVPNIKDTPEERRADVLATMENMEADLNAL